jgi:drug/metabolite transporter (DMT)-like permease
MMQLDRSDRPSPIWIFLALVFLIFVWSLNYVVGKVGFRELPALALGSFRIVVAGIASLPVFFRVAGESRAPVGRFRRGDNRKEILYRSGAARKSTLRFIWTVSYLGFFGVVLNQGCFTVGLNYTSVSHSSLIIACAPILILVFSWMARLEALTPRKIAGMALAFIGAAAVGIEQGGGSGGATVLGDLITAIAALGLALYTVMGKRTATEHGPVRMSLLMNIAGGVLVLPVAVWQFHELARAGRLAAIGWQGWGAVIYMGVLASAVSYILYFWALRYMTPARLGSVSYLQPIGATLLGFVLLGEAITPRVAIGGLLVIAGVYAIETHPHRPEPAEGLA